MPETVQRRDVYTTSQVADILCVTTDCVRKRAQQGKIPFYTLPGASLCPHRRISHTALVSWLKSQPDSGYALRRLGEAV